MCLAIPAKVVTLKGSIAQVDMMGNERIISTDLVPEVKLGDYVLVHAGFAIGIIDDESAKETEELLLEVAKAYEEEE
ncbi:HypC/HybG/HupF family hydrogenase formation chaperone [Desulfosporosinus sp.]|uniref:HypC/HybG/HupF family hydrogenase formation chaperone n=1 Tax=Desulfosporosinus sp. TaxID=157907 RepID=UPI000E8C0AE4|nr:HypC/HybG/HupF family hydrogenase formation chaperone [Desulfosporosinus sp.]MBC2722313.1 HypC/HybG/HupF family hydrogenase formation chaperone [Desulfosporosinus sp.]MBC2727766.1 HypC/HybG/HupF family hydrogenase formation chaperone [Desulfosporosinus sp.]HBV88951.1 HypC/HybG/HupF family hydrogenase formation chaperone [Desulfosporosinus sp.]